MRAQEEEEMGVTEEMAYAPITYNDGSSIDFQDKTLLDLTLAGEPAAQDSCVSRNIRLGKRAVPLSCVSPSRMARIISSAALCSVQYASEPAHWLLRTEYILKGLWFCFNGNKLHRRESWCVESRGSSEPTRGMGKRGMSFEAPVAYKLSEALDSALPQF